MILTHFEELTDPRVDRTKLHRLGDMVAFAICGAICGADTWADVERLYIEINRLLDSGEAPPEGTGIDWHLAVEARRAVLRGLRWLVNDHILPRPPSFVPHIPRCPWSDSRAEKGWKARGCEIPLE